jgi:hypothetical protein
MKKLYTTIILALIAIGANAQAPNWAWAKGGGGSTNDYCQGSSTDAFGNVYITGFYDSPSITFGTTTLINGGNQDIFFVKYDPSGNLVWAKGLGSTGNDRGLTITTDALGNVYIAGNYESPTLTFGTTTLTNLSTNGFNDLFIAKFDASGNLVWAKTAGNAGNESASSIKCDVSGNIYLAGSYESVSITFGTTTLTNIETTGFFSDLFIVKYDASGNVLWANSAGGIETDESYFITTDDSNNVYVTGWYSDDLIVGPFTLTSADSTGLGDVFIVKYDTNGNVVWAHGYGNVGNDFGCSITTDNLGNIYLTGFYAASSITFGAFTLSSSAATNMFIVKYNAVGNVLWAQAAVSSGGSIGYCVTTDPSGSVYVGGIFSSTFIEFGTTTLTNVGSNGYSDIFIVKYDSLGNSIWAINVNGTGYDAIVGLTCDSFGNIYVAGHHLSTLAFGSTSLTSAGDKDIYIAKLDATIVGSEKMNRFEGFSIYPNPSNGIFKISKNVKTIEVFNLMGELILSQGNINEINLNAFPSGMYVARVNGENLVRLLKE